MARALSWLQRRPDLGVRVVLIGVGTPRTHRREPCLQLDRLNERVEREARGPMDERRQPGPADDAPDQGLLGPLIAGLRADGVIVVAPSGNAGDAYAMSYPACLSPVLSVGATYDAARDGFAHYDLDPQVPGQVRHCADETIRVDAIPCFSNGDPLLLDLVAPGASIRAAGLAGGSIEASGTSAAAAHVVGAAALLLHEEPRRSTPEVQGAIRRAAALVPDRRPPPEGARPMVDGERPERPNGLSNGYIAYRLDLGALFSRDCFDGDGDGVGSRGRDCGPLLDCADDDPRVYPGQIERCDGRDNDCDDRVDEGFELGGACQSGVGACAVAGVFECAPDGSRAHCSAEAPPPSPEACNGLDDDCDGRADEGLEPRTVTFFRTGEACCDYYQEDGVSPGEPPREGPYFDVAEGQVIRVRVRYASDGHVGCEECDCPATAATRAA